MTDKLIDMNVFWDALEEEASQPSFDRNLIFGKIEIKPHRWLKWTGVKGAAPEEITPEVFNTLSLRERTLEVMLTVPLKDFRPTLDWDNPFYERRFNIGDADWHGIFVPSVEALFGPKSMTAGTYAKTLQKVNGKYAMVADQNSKKKKNVKADGTPMGMVEILKLYPDRKSCLAEYEAKYGKREDDASATTIPEPTSGVDIPEGWEEPIWFEQIKQDVGADKESAQIAKQLGVSVPQVLAAKKHLGLT